MLVKCFKSVDPERARKKGNTKMLMAKSKNNKCTGENYIPTKVLNALWKKIQKSIVGLLTKLWRDGTTFKNWCLTLLVLIYNMGNKKSAKTTEIALLYNKQWPKLNPGVNCLRISASFKKGGQQ